MNKNTIGMIAIAYILFSIMLLIRRGEFYFNNQDVDLPACRVIQQYDSYGLAIKTLVSSTNNKLQVLNGKLEELQATNTGIDRNEVNLLYNQKQ